MASVGYSLEDRYQPSAKLLNRTASSGFSYLAPKPAQQLQQRLPVVRSLSNSPTGYNSLPRQRSRPSEGAPASLPHARRKLVNSAIQDYLKSLNAMTRSIVLETETVEKENQCNWKKMDTASKEDIVNDHFMPADVRLHYEHERAASCCSDWSLDAGSMVSAGSHCQPHRETLVVENRPEEWEEMSGRHSARSNRDLVYANQWSSNQRDDLSLSQPSLVESQEVVQDSNFNRLHKKQLSFRPSHKQHAVKPTRQAPQYSSFRNQLGSDGESPRTSDEDYEVVQPLHLRENPLGFQRSKLRSYSMRSKRGAGGNSAANLRSSVRTSNRIKIDTADTSDSSSSDAHCRPSHYHSYSNTSADTDFDEAIDMPDDALLMDHVVSRKSSVEETDIDDDYVVMKTPKYTRTRRSFRAAPKICLEQDELSLAAAESTTSLSTTLSSSDAFLAAPDHHTTPSSQAGLYRPPSRESLDLDSISMAPSDISKYDEEDQSRMMTPDSMLSVSSGYSSRPWNKSGEIAVLRSRRGKRGGSHIKVATSDFADRHTQFKNNMLQQKSQLLDGTGSASTTRPTSPASSVSSSPAHHAHYSSHQDGNGFLKAPPSFAYGSKHDSLAESTTSDLPCSPDQLSVVSSPPATPLAISHTSQLRTSVSSAHHEHRESGYMSSSSETFQVAGRR